MVTVEQNRSIGRQVGGKARGREGKGRERERERRDWMPVDGPAVGGLLAIRSVCGRVDSYPVGLREGC